MEMGRSRIGRREREARKRRRRAWVSGSVIADSRYFSRYPRAGSQPLKLGKRHLDRFWRAAHRTVADSRKPSDKPSARE